MVTKIRDFSDTHKSCGNKENKKGYLGKLLVLISCFSIAVSPCFTIVQTLCVCLL